MRFHGKTGYVLLFLGVLFVLYGCAHIGGDETPEAEPPEGGVSVEASFRQEDGEALGESTVRVSMEADSVDKARLRDDVSLESFIAGFRLASGIAHELGTGPPYSFRQEEEERIGKE